MRMHSPSYIAVQDPIHAPVDVIITDSRGGEFCVSWDPIAGREAVVISTSRKPWQVCTTLRP